jgi:hypothetical protein
VGPPPLHSSQRDPAAAGDFCHPRGGPRRGRGGTRRRRRRGTRLSTMLKLPKRKLLMLSFPVPLSCSSISSGGFKLHCGAGAKPCIQIVNPCESFFFIREGARAHIRTTHTLPTCSKILSAPTSIENQKDSTNNSRSHHAKIPACTSVRRLALSSRYQIYHTRCNYSCKFHQSDHQLPHVILPFRRLINSRGKKFKQGLH